MPRLFSEEFGVWGKGEGKGGAGGALKQLRERLARAAPGPGRRGDTRGREGSARSGPGSCQGPARGGGRARAAAPTKAPQTASCVAFCAGQESAQPLRGARCAQRSPTPAFANRPPRAGPPGSGGGRSPVPGDVPRLQTPAQRGPPSPGRCAASSGGGWGCNGGRSLAGRARGKGPGANFLSLPKRARRRTSRLLQSEPLGSSELRAARGGEPLALPLGAQALGTR